jgi:formate dehydrogenase subunit beta
MQDELIKRACELLSDGTVSRVLGWSAGDFFYDITPTVFESAEDVRKHFVYNDFCGANLSKYLIAESQKEGKIAVFLKPCDTYSFNQLMTEHRLKRENIYVIGIPCDGKVSAETLHDAGIHGILGVKKTAVILRARRFTERRESHLTRHRMRDA